MAAKQQNETILFPVGRLVGGDLYKPNTTDTNGQPLTIKNGPNRGQARQDYVVVVAIPKTPGVTHWAHEQSPNPRIGAWGQKLWALVHQAWPQPGVVQRRDFAFKIGDGDSTEIDKGGRRNVDKVGYPGHWILRFGGGYAPKIVDSTGQTEITQEGAVKRGFYVQVAGTYSGNDSGQTPGMYLNHQIVAFSGYGEEIRSGPDARAVGFGGDPLPAGATAIPQGSMMPPGNMPPAPGAPAAPGMPPMPGVPPAAPPAPAAAQPPGLPPMPGAPAMPGMPPAPAAAQPPGLPPMPGAAAPAAPAAPGLPVVPNPAFAAVPPAPPAPAPAPAPAPRRLVVTAQGHTQQTLNAAGYNDDTIVANGWGVWQ